MLNYKEISSTGFFYTALIVTNGVRGGIAHGTFIFEIPYQLTNELKRRLKIVVTALEIMCLAACLKMYVKVKFSLSLKECKESVVDPEKKKISYRYRISKPRTLQSYRLCSSGSLKNVRTKTGVLFVLCGCKSWSLILKVRPMFRLFERGFESKRGEKMSD